MTTVEILDEARTRLASATEETRSAAQLAFDAASHNQRRVEVLALAEDYPGREALVAQYAEERTVELPPEPTPEEVTESRYLDRAQVAPRIMARWAAYNDRKLTSGEWALEDFATFLPAALTVSAILGTYAFGEAAKAVQNFDHPLATAEAKADYLAIMAEEYPDMFKE